MVPTSCELRISRQSVCGTGKHDSALSDPEGDQEPRQLEDRCSETGVSTLYQSMTSLHFIGFNLSYRPTARKKAIVKVEKGS